MIVWIPLILPLVFTPPPVAHKSIGGHGGDFEARATASADDVASMRELRYRGMFGQQDWYTCGAAAVATWLTYFLDRPTTEAEVLALSARHMEDRGGDPMEGLTLLSLRESLAFFGIQADGYEVDVDGLKQYFASGGQPILIHVTRPRFHYVLAVGAHDETILLADPAYGRRALTFDALVEEKGFDGIVLAATVDPLTAQKTVEKQIEFVASFVHRQGQLRRLWEGVAR